jgi:NAD(P)H dehydrogenase (quinone)
VTDAAPATSAATIAVTGATGHLGSLVIDSLLERGPARTVVAVARNPDKARGLAERGVTVRIADYSQPGALVAALAGVGRLLLISGSEVGQRVAQHTNVITAARTAGVPYVAYTSAPRADSTPLALAAEHKATEAVLAASGLAYTILRNNWYHENYLSQIGPAAESGVVIGSTHGGRVASASRADYAAATAAVLTSDGHENAIYELGGDLAWDYGTLAAAISTVSGRPVTYRDLSTAEHVEVLKSQGLDQATAQFVAAIDTGVAAGALAEVSGDLHRLIGRDTTPLVDSLRAALAV